MHVNLIGEARPEDEGEECWRRSDVLEWNLNWLTPGGLWHLTELLLGAIDPDAELIMECDGMEERKSSASELGFPANNWWQNVKTRGRMKLLIRRRSIKTFHFYYRPSLSLCFLERYIKGSKKTLLFRHCSGYTLFTMEYKWSIG